jgi:hypothetical protein
MRHGDRFSPRIRRAAALILGTALAATLTATDAGLGPQPSAARASTAAAPSAVVSRLSLAQLAGQRIIYAYGGLVPP